MSLYLNTTIQRSTKVFLWLRDSPPCTQKRVTQPRKKTSADICRKKVLCVWLEDKVYCERLTISNPFGVPNNSNVPLKAVLPTLQCIFPFIMHCSNSLRARRGIGNHREGKEPRWKLQSMESHCWQPGGPRGGCGCASCGLAEWSPPCLDLV